MGRETAEFQLLSSAKAGDRIALQRLLISEANLLLASIGRRLQEVDNSLLDAEDLLQQTFIDAFRDIRHFQGATIPQFQSWLRTIADHSITDALRYFSRAKRGGQNIQQHAVPAGSAQSLIDILDLQPDSIRTPSSCVRHNEAVDALQIAIRNLPDDYRRAVELRYLKGHSLEEVAELMGRGARAVQGLLDRARKLLREELQSI